MIDLPMKANDIPFPYSLPTTLQFLSFFFLLISCTRLCLFTPQSLMYSIHSRFFCPCCFYLSNVLRVDIFLFFLVIYYRFPLFRFAYRFEFLPQYNTKLDLRRLWNLLLPSVVVLLFRLFFLNRICLWEPLVRSTFILLDRHHRPKGRSFSDVCSFSF